MSGFLFVGHLPAGEFADVERDVRAEQARELRADLRANLAAMSSRDGQLADLHARTPGARYDVRAAGAIAALLIAAGIHWQRGAWPSLTAADAQPPPTALEQVSKSLGGVDPMIVAGGVGALLLVILLLKNR